MGFIAEEVEEVVPELAMYNENKELEAVAYERFGALAIGAIQELSTKLDTALSRIAELESK